MRFGPYSEQFGHEEYTGTDYPKPLWCGYDKKVDIGVLMCCVHGERIGNRHHSKSRNPPNESDEILGFLEELSFFGRSGFFDAENGFKFFYDVWHKKGMD